MPPASSPHHDHARPARPPLRVAPDAAHHGPARRAAARAHRGGAAAADRRRTPPVVVHPVSPIGPIGPILPVGPVAPSPPIAPTPPPTPTPPAPPAPPSQLGDAVCAGDQPLALLPMRLETRFFPQAGGASELRIRIYPDKVQIDTHETALTPDERDWGEHYWTAGLARRRRCHRARRGMEPARHPLRRRARRVDRAPARADERRAAAERHGRARRRPSPRRRNSRPSTSSTTA